jgi:hypothetical protein
MKTFNQTQHARKLPVLIIATLLAWPGLLPNTVAVSPAPDGGYAGGNTAEGQSALLTLTTGTYDTALGFYSLLSNTTGSFNTAVGAGTLLANTGTQNTATGAGALLSNATGNTNTANGAFALFNNTEGGGNTATGNEALFNNTAGNVNTADGSEALLNNTTGISNTATGGLALFSNTAGGSNTAIGRNALSNNTTGNHNTALGNGAGSDVTTANNVICIGDGVTGEDVSNSCYIGNIFNQTISGGGAVVINLDGKLGTTSSSRRFKGEIRPMDKASEALLALKPVTFRYKKEIDPAGISQFGLVAEDVEKVNRDLVLRDKEGKPYTVRYDQVNAMLLNEFLKEHKKVEEQQATIAELKSTVAQQQKEIESVVAGFQEQDAKIQRVNDQLRIGQRAPQMIVNNK